VAAAGIKHLHVLPFVTQFCLLVHDMEVAVLDGVAAAGGSGEGGAAAGAREHQGEAPGVAEEAAGLAAARSVRAGEPHCCTGRWMSCVSCLACI
jgi:hypothetical protein